MALLVNFCFTINNYTEEDINNLQSLDFAYLVYGREIAPTTNTPHLQGYCELKKKTRFNTVKKQIPTAHIEDRKGTQKQAIDYCKKDGDFSEFGVAKVQGARTDLDRVRQEALDGGMRKVTAQYNLQQIKTAEKFLTYNEEPRDWKPEVIWLWGETGSGKSRQAREICGDDVYTKNDGTKWWDGYDAHESVIIDDFRPSWWSITEMLSLLDRYEKRVEVKGGYRQFKPRKIVVTSALAPSACYANTGESIKQLLRRIDVTRQLVPDVPEVAGVILDPAPPSPELADNIEITDEEVNNIVSELNI